MREDVALQMPLRQGSVRTQLAFEALLSLVSLQVDLVRVSVRKRLTALLTLQKNVFF